MKEVAPLASCTGCIPVIKDGEDGIGIMDANVLFAISSSGSMPPEDTADWKDTYAELPFSLSSFLWACTRITYTNKTSKLTGKYCVGACKDLASVTELYALGDSNINPPSGGWSQKFTPTKGKWLWTKNELTFSNGKMAETTPVCICYFGNDGVNGTKFTPKGTAYGHYTASSKMPKPSDDIAGLLYLVDKVDNPLSPVNSPCTAYWRSFSDNSYMLSYDAAEEGDAYNVDGTLWVHNGTVWKDFGSIQGPKGDDGKDALWTILTPDAVMFESDDNGAVKASSKDVVIRVYRGREIVTSKCKFSILAASDSHFDVESYAKLADSAVEGTKTLTINSKGIGTKTVAGINVSYPTSYVYLHITYDGNSFMATIKILVDTTAVDGYFRTSVKGLEAKYTSVETVVNNNASTLKTHESSIQANANEIKKRVTETTFNAGLDQIQSNVSEVDQKADKISSRVTDTEKNLKSEIAQTASGISAKVKELSDGVAATGIDIKNKSINMTADKFTLKNNNEEKTFGVDEDGNSFLKGTIEASAGKIAGLKIAGNGLTNNGFDNDSYIVFRNDNNNQFVGIGNVGVTGGPEILGRFENDKKGEISNVALRLSATNANRNFAFAGNGNGFLNGYISGYAYQTINADKENTVFIIEPKESMLFLVHPTKESASVGLPMHQDVASMLGIGQKDNFVVPIEIVLFASKTFIYGRTAEVKGMDNGNYPIVGYDQKKKINEAFSGGWVDYYFRGGYNKFLLSYIDGTYSAIDIQTTLYSNITYDSNNE